MIATWMLSATLLALLLGVAAVAVERALRTLGREARAPWLVALAGGVAWPAIAPVVAALFHGPPGGGAPAIVPAARSAIGAIASTLPAVPASWAPFIDAALLALWALASAFLLARLALALRALSRVEHSATEDVIEGVPVLVTPVLGPAVFGARRPRMLVPRWLLDLDAPLRALVLCHEEEHCRARDPRLTLAAAVAVACMPWNAGVWWIAHRLRLAVELDCDARVLRIAGDARRYGTLLLLIAQRQSHARLAPMLAESNSHLSRRITAMNAPRPAKPRARVAILMLVAAGAIAWSTKYATALTTPPSLSGRALTRLSQGGDTTCLLGPPATQAPNSAVPRYPEILRSARVEGEVLASFIVRPAGVAEPRSFRVLHATHELFASAVLSALPNMIFVPAEVGGKKVSQLVQQPFFFDVQGSKASASRKPPVGSGSCSPPDPKGVWTLRAIIVTVPN